MKLLIVTNDTVKKCFNILSGSSYIYNKIFFTK